ncbi:S8 family serine peptidase [Shewanella amazonensis]|uniref:Peptidase S8 and S53, subtilisin, kexin, sedolisin n=1 Tax=Shewanella amazonensis (strain ATCC BAA-1098 / SB2B) TaxID=326297 RepID=A1S7R6_SHEAM|nr:S8 family serine peptidase [Shewanella amazonensis]ABM00423.1 peptidase S8 and S53, subtilisin, kexin, sedolisin [Shewanella amazonensis SB2B]
MHKSIISLSVAAVLLAGCGSDNKAKPEPVNTAPVSQDVTYDARQSIRLEGVLDGKDAEGGITFSLVDPTEVKLGTLKIEDAKKGSFSYLTDAMEGTEIVRFKVSDGKSESISTLTVQINGGDPLFEHQWHLKNTGQNAFAKNRGVAGEDMNVSEAIASGVTGKGVVVAVVDDGLEISHPDLKNNVIAGGSYNLITGTIDPTPFADSASHGTSVGGIIAAEGWNGLGGRGVAPEASLIGFNFLDHDPTGKVKSVQTFENFAKSHGASAYSDTARVFNQSYGYSVPFPHGFDEDENEVYAAIGTDSFDGKGSIFVKSAGNGYDYYRSMGTFWLPGDYFSAPKEGKAPNQGLPFHNSNMSSDNANVYNLVVSAINAEGKRSSYSSVGSNVFLTAPGGEYGVDDPAIVTTDRVSCDKGSSVANERPSTPFDGGLHPLNLECDYRSTMNGTSSAAPNTSGAVAMIMSANPNLSWRDVRHILAATSTKVDADIPAKTVAIGSEADAPEYEAIPAWLENAAGYHFHNEYGFGRVDVSAAVAMAQDYKADLGDYMLTDWIASEADLDKVIPDASLSGVSDSLDVAEDLIVEAVQIELTADHLRLPDLAVELISPAGTRSVLMTPYNGMVYQGVMDPTDPSDLVTGYDATPMLSNAFYGESAKGEWTIKLIDVNSGEYRFLKYDRGYISIPNESNGMLKGWSIRFHGHKAKVAS